MAEMLLINPRRRRASPKRKSAKRRTGARRRRNPIAGRPARMPISRRSPSRRRRRNPIANLRIGRRRRRNPISLGGLNSKSLMSMLTDAAIGGAGALTMDVLMGQINGFLPASFQTSPSTVGLGDAVKAGITALLGQALSKTTKGLSRKMAMGALTVQAAEIMASLLPASMTVGYLSPARIVNGQARIGPNRGVGAYMRPGVTPMLSRAGALGAYLPAGARTPMLNARPSVQQREGVSTYR